MSKFMMSVVGALLVAGSAFAAQCAATTKKGVQCTREATVGQYCAQHAKMMAAKTNTTTKASAPASKKAKTHKAKKAAN